MTQDRNLSNDYKAWLAQGHPIIVRMGEQVKILDREYTRLGEFLNRYDQGEIVDAVENQRDILSSEIFDLLFGIHFLDMDLLGELLKEEPGGYDYEWFAENMRECF